MRFYYSPKAYIYCVYSLYILCHFFTHHTTTQSIVEPLSKLNSGALTTATLSHQSYSLPPSCFKCQTWDYLLVKLAQKLAMVFQSYKVQSH